MSLAGFLHLFCHDWGKYGEPHTKITNYYVYGGQYEYSIRSKWQTKTCRFCGLVREVEISYAIFDKNLN